MNEHPWTSGQRRIFVLCLAASVVSFYSFLSGPYLLTEAAKQLRLSVDQSSLLYALPLIASLLAVFLAGLFGDCHGRRKAMLVGGIAYSVGSFIALLSGSFEALVVARAMEGLGVVFLRVSSLALTASFFQVPVQRTFAIGAFGACVALIQVVAPLSAATLASAFGWKSIAVVWLIIGLIFIVLTLVLLPRGETIAQRQPTELVTPLLAGFTALSVCLSLSSFQEGRSHGFAMLAAGLSALTLLILMLRKRNNWSLTLDFLARPGASFMIISLVLVSASDPVFITGLYLHKQHHLPTMQLGLAMIPVSICAAIGSLAAGPLIAKFNIFRATIGACVLAIIAAIALRFSALNSPVAVIIIVISGYILVNKAAYISLLGAVLGLAPPGKAGSAAGWSLSAAICGVAIGSVVLNGLVFNTFQAELTEMLERTPITRSLSGQVAALVRQGKRNLVPEFFPTLKAPELTALISARSPLVKQARFLAFRPIGPVLAGTNLLAIWALWMAHRGRSHRRAVPAASGTKPEGD